MVAMNSPALIPVSSEISILNGFELTIQAHEKELDFVPDMGTDESRKASSEALKSARKTWKEIDDFRLAEKKEAEKLANAIHEQGRAALSRLETGYAPHKSALDGYKAEQAQIEEAKAQAFNNLCEWLRDMVADAQVENLDAIKNIIQAVESKHMDNTGLNITKDQKLAYGKMHMEAQQKLQRALGGRIIRDAEDERQRVQAMELADAQEAIRVQQEELQRQQQAIKAAQVIIDSEKVGSIIEPKWFSFTKTITKEEASVIYGGKLADGMYELSLKFIG
jgi:hypothetical protein